MDYTFTGDTLTKKIQQTLKNNGIADMLLGEEQTCMANLCGVL
jgi:hypothetical protein